MLHVPLRRLDSDHDRCFRSVNCASPLQDSVAETVVLTSACRYVAALRPRSFSEHDLLDPQARFYFRDKAIASKSGDISHSEPGHALFKAWCVCDRLQQSNFGVELVVLVDQGHRLVFVLHVDQTPRTCCAKA